MISSTPPTLLSRCGNPDVEHAHYYSLLHSAIKRSVWKTITEVTLKYNLYVSIVYYSYVLNNFVLVLAIIITQVINLCRITFITSVPPLYIAYLGQFVMQQMYRLFFPDYSLKLSTLQCPFMKCRGG